MAVLTAEAWTASIDFNKSQTSLDVLHIYEWCENALNATTMLNYFALQLLPKKISSLFDPLQYRKRKSSNRWLGYLQTLLFVNHRHEDQDPNRTIFRLEERNAKLWQIVCPATRSLISSVFTKRLRGTDCEAWCDFMLGQIHCPFRSPLRNELTFHWLRYAVCQVHSSESENIPRAATSACLGSSNHTGLLSC